MVLPKAPASPLALPSLALPAPYHPVHTSDTTSPPLSHQFEGGFRRQAYHLGPTAERPRRPAGGARDHRTAADRCLTNIQSDTTTGGRSRRSLMNWTRLRGLGRSLAISESVVHITPSSFTSPRNRCRFSRKRCSSASVRTKGLHPFWSAVEWKTRFRTSYP